MPAVDYRRLPCASSPEFPGTRYQGSKRKLAGAIVEAVSHLDFHSVLDAFGGTGAVAHAFKSAGRSVTYNDVLHFNYQIGLALIENDNVRLSTETAESLSARIPGRRYDDTIRREFEGIYFTDEENEWLDVTVGNIRVMENRFERAIAWFALFQAALAKRPYNLFHRRNLYMRTASVRRSFGNKTTWDRSFQTHFVSYVQEANQALVDSHGACLATCGDALEIEPIYDLVYVDTPYVKCSGTGVDYRDFYHFLEGLMHYDNWPTMIDRQSKHRRLHRDQNPWSKAQTCSEMFRQLFHHFRESILVVSYRSDGVPAIDELAAMMREVKREVSVVRRLRYQYTLSTNRKSQEVVIIGT